MYKFIRVFLVFILLAVIFVLSGFNGQPSVDSRNIALGKTYTVQSKPNYSETTNDTNGTKLTDGKYAKWDIVGKSFWMQNETVGWMNSRYVEITIDLGEDYPISGVSYSTAAGKAGVTWPSVISISTSADGKIFYETCNLTDNQNGNVNSEYKIFKYTSNELETHGRYMKFIVETDGPYFFIDEIEVYLGKEEWKKKRIAGKEIRDYKTYKQEIYSKEIMNSDLTEVIKRIKSSNLKTEEIKGLVLKADGIKKEINKMTYKDMGEFKTVIPLNYVHKKIFKLLAELRMTQGEPKISANVSNRWDYFTPFDNSKNGGKEGIDIQLMRGEIRSGAFNITNNDLTENELLISLNKNLISKCGDKLEVRKCLWTTSDKNEVVSDALIPMEREDAGFKIAIPSGMTVQVWITINSKDLEFGKYKSKIICYKNGKEEFEIPLNIRVFSLDFPKKQSLHLGGWDYTDSFSLGVTKENRDIIISYLKEYFIDSPWAVSVTMPYGKFDNNGDFKEQPDTMLFDQWIKNWPVAWKYYVYKSVRDDIAGVNIKDQRFDKCVGTWISFWAGHMEKIGLKKEQLSLLLVDEPNKPIQDELILKWAKAIKKAEPDINIWENPMYKNPLDAKPEMIRILDTLCLNRTTMLREDKKYYEFFINQNNNGKKLNIYSCEGPSRILDPYSYYRLQAWECYKLNAEASFFWSFTDNGSGNCWQENLIKPYTPFFLENNRINDGKQMEAVREGIEDYEYLKMLNNKIIEMRNKDKTKLLKIELEKVLNDAVKNTLQTNSVKEINWSEPKDRTIADLYRIKIAEILEKLN